MLWNTLHKDSAEQPRTADDFQRSRAKAEAEQLKATEKEKRHSLSNARHPNDSEKY